MWSIFVVVHQPLIGCHLRLRDGVEQDDVENFHAKNLVESSRERMLLGLGWRRYNFRDNTSLLAGLSKARSAYIRLRRLFSALQLLDTLELMGRHASIFALLWTVGRRTDTVFATHLCYSQACFTFAQDRQYLAYRKNRLPRRLAAILNFS